VNVITENGLNMINPFKEINWHPDGAETRKFGLTVLVGFAVISVLIVLGGYAGVEKFSNVPDISTYLLSAGIIIFAVSYFAPAVARPLYLIWFFVAACIGIVVSNLILMIFFYLVFAPIGLLMRLSGRDPLKLKKSPGLSNWDACKRKTDLKRYYRQY